MPLTRAASAPNRSPTHVASHLPPSPTRLASPRLASPRSVASVTVARTPPSRTTASYRIGLLPAPPPFPVAAAPPYTAPSPPPPPAPTLPPPNRRRLLHTAAASSWCRHPLPAPPPPPLFALSLSPPPPPHAAPSCRRHLLPAPPPAAVVYSIQTEGTVSISLSVAHSPSPTVVARFLSPTTVLPPTTLPRQRHCRHDAGAASSHVTSVRCGRFSDGWGSYDQRGKRFLTNQTMLFQAQLKQSLSVPSIIWEPGNLVYDLQVAGSKYSSKDQDSFVHLLLSQYCC